MMFYKIRFLFILLILMAATLCACANGTIQDNSQPSTTPTAASTPADVATKPSTTSPTEEAVLSDQQLIDKVNAILAADENKNGKADLYSKALNIIRKNKISLPLTPTEEGNVFHWNRETNRFEILKQQAAPLNKSDFQDKKIIIYGDSITRGVGASDKDSKGYVPLLAEALNTTIDNRGKSGYVISTNAKERDGTLLNSHFNNIIACDDPADYVIVALGVNDWTRSNVGDTIQLGTLGSTDTTTIYGAYNVCMKALTENYKGTNTKIIFATPTPTDWLLGRTSGKKNGDFNSITANDNGYTLQDICYAIKETAALYQISVMDMHSEIGIDHINANVYLADGVHPSDTGHQKMAELWEAYLLNNYSYIN